MRTQGELSHPHTSREASGGPCPAHTWTLGFSLQDQGTVRYLLGELICGVCYGAG